MRLAVDGKNMQFSNQEKLILICLISGATDKQIARRLGISAYDVRSTMKYLLPKVGARNRTQAALWAWRHTETIHNGLINGHHYR